MHAARAWGVASRNGWGLVVAGVVSIESSLAHSKTELRERTGHSRA